MNQTTRKFFSVVLVLCLLFTFAGASTAFAADLPATEPQVTEPQVTEPIVTPETPQEETSSPTENPENTDTPEPSTTETPAKPSATETPLPEATVSPEPEASVATVVSMEELLVLAQQDGTKAAELINTYTDDAAFAEAVKQVLDLYYENGLTDQLQAFSAVIDARAAELLQNYSQAAAERMSTHLGYAPGEVLVVFNSGIAQPQAIAAMDSLDSTLEQTVETPASEVVAVVEIPLDQTVEQAVSEISADPAVAYAQPNYLYELAEAAPDPSAYLSAVPNDPDVNKQWHFDKINAGEAWDIVNIKHGQKVKVAVLDSTADIQHQDLASNVVPSQSFDMQTGTAKPYKTTGATHGTHVSGIMGAVANNGAGGTGIGSGSTNQVMEMIELNVLNDITNKASTSVLIAAINQAVQSGAKVINMSLGYESTGHSIDQLFETAIDSAVSKGTVVVAAACNYSSDAVFYPSDFANVISVINTKNYTDPTSNAKASSSNYGANKTISAPGESIYSTILSNNYGINSGTSMAAPIVSGVVAMMLYVNPSLTPAQITSMLTSTATDLYTPGFDVYTAWGNVNAYRAVATAAGIDIPSTPQNLSASNHNYNSVALSWKVVSGVTGYHIYRAETEAGAYSLVRTNTANTQTAYTDTGLVPGKTYYYKVAAYSMSDGNEIESIYAGPVSATPTLPSPGNVKAVKNTGVDSATLSWSSVSGASGYEIYRSTNSSSDYSLLYTTSSATETSYTDTAVLHAGTYYYKVNAYSLVNGEKAGGSPSTPVSVYISDTPQAVSNLAAQSSDYSSITISWDLLPDASGYNIYSSTSENGTYTSIGTTKEGQFISTKLATGKAYYYKVAAYRTSGSSKIEGDFAGPVSAKAVNAAPENLKAVSASYNSVKLTWTKSAGASGYDIYRATSQTGSYSRIATNSGANTVSYISSKLSVGRTYYYKVVPFRNMSFGKVTGNEAGPISGTPVSEKPINLVGKGLDTSSIGLTWEKPAGANGYLVYRSITKSGGYKLIKTLESSATSVSYTDSGLVPNSKYYYKVIPYTNVSGTKVKGQTAGPVSAETKSNKVEGITATCTAYNQISVSWNKVAGAYGYQLFRSTNASTGFVNIKTLRANSWVDSSGLGTPKQYFYKVRSFSTVDGKKVYGAYSSVVSATTFNTKPEYSIGVPKIVNNNTTSSLFSMTNRGKFDLVILADSAKFVDNPNEASRNDRNLTLWVDGVKVTDKIVLKPGEQKKVSITCSPATVYTPDTHLLFKFTYDGRTCLNDVYANGRPEWKYV